MKIQRMVVTLTYEREVPYDNQTIEAIPEEAAWAESLVNNINVALGADGEIIEGTPGVLVDIDVPNPPTLHEQSLKEEHPDIRAFLQQIFGERDEMTPEEQASEAALRG